MGKAKSNKRQAHIKTSNKTNNNGNNVVKLNTFQPKKQRNVEILPRNRSQEDYVMELLDTDKNIVFGIGPAGTGKTLLACQSAVKAFLSGEVERIVVTRPAVSADEDLGFLPGTLEEKMAPWTRPIFDIFEKHFSVAEIESMLAENIIEIAPLAYMRGRTFEDAWIIADEMQNATKSQMKMLLTRIGNNTKMIVTGDLKQHDRGFSENGLSDFMELTRRYELANMNHIAISRFDMMDVERHPAVVEVLKIYGEDE